MLLISYMESGAAICLPRTTAPPSICPWVPCVPFCHQLSDSEQSGFFFLFYLSLIDRMPDVTGLLGKLWLLRQRWHPRKPWLFLTNPLPPWHPLGSPSPCFVFMYFFSSSPLSLLCLALSSRYNTPLPFFPPSPLPVSGGSRLCSRHSATCPCHS